jgi:hypothetical protein
MMEFSNIFGKYFKILPNQALVPPTLTLTLTLTLSLF